MAATASGTHSSSGERREGGDTVFGKIIRREIPATIVYETDSVLAFEDVNPQAPFHVLVIPKTPVRDAATADARTLGDVFAAAAEVARRAGHAEGGFRLVTNTGPAAGQSVPHFHVHVLAGRDLSWPPG